MVTYNLFGKYIVMQVYVLRLNTIRYATEQIGKAVKI